MDRALIRKVQARTPRRFMKRTPKRQSDSDANDRATRFIEGVEVGRKLVQVVTVQPAQFDDVVRSAARRIITHPEEMLGPEGAGVVAGVLGELPEGRIKDVVKDALASRPVADLLVALLAER
jgi:hypothetical protein